APVAPGSARQERRPGFLAGPSSPHRVAVGRRALLELVDRDDGALRVVGDDPAAHQPGRPDLLVLAVDADLLRGLVPRIVRNGLAREADEHVAVFAVAVDDLARRRGRSAVLERDEAPDLDAQDLFLSGRRVLEAGDPERVLAPFEPDFAGP